MSLAKTPCKARQLSTIGSTSSQEVNSIADRDSSEMSTERKDFVMTDFSFSASSSANGHPEIPSRISSLNLNRPTGTIPQDATDGTKDAEKNDTISSDGSEPKVADMVNHGEQDPFAQESEGGVQYRTMAWWYGYNTRLLLFYITLSSD